MDTTGFTVSVISTMCTDSKSVVVLSATTTGMARVRREERRTMRTALLDVVV